jgi:hypothetical protein
MGKQNQMNTLILIVFFQLHKRKKFNPKYQFTSDLLFFKLFDVSLFIIQVFSDFIF